MSFRIELEREDRRGGAPARRRWPVASLVALLVLAAAAAGSWAAWRVMAQHRDGGAIPLLRADERPVKIPPANPGGLDVPDQDKLVLDPARRGATRVEQLLPPPETPLPRPVAPETPAAAVPPPSSPPPPAPAVAAAELPPVAAAAVAPPVAAPQSAPVPQPVAAAPGAGYRLQLGSVRSEEAARQEWARLKRVDGDLLGGFAAETPRIDLGERGVYYRILVGPLADAAAGARTCEELKRRKIGCILVKP